MPVTSALPKKSRCVFCDKEVTRSDEPYRRDEYYDEDVLDYDNSGLTCDDGDPHVIAEMPITIHEIEEIEDVL